MSHSFIQRFVLQVTTHSFSRPGTHAHSRPVWEHLGLPPELALRHRPRRHAWPQLRELEPDLGIRRTLPTLLDHGAERDAPLFVLIAQLIVIFAQDLRRSGLDNSVVSW